MSEQTGPKFPPYIYGLHEAGGEAHMLQAGRPGWVLELAAIGLDGRNTPADFSRLASQGLGVMVRINHAYGSGGTVPTPDRYTDFAAACARYVARSQGCHIWIIGNEPNHELEWPNGQPILPTQYAQVYTLCRNAIRNLEGHANDLVLVAGSAPWNARTTYPGNEKGDWIRYFSDVLAQLGDAGCDGFAIHTYTHDLDPRQITGDFLHVTPGYRHLRNEFRTYRDYMNAIPDRFRRLPVFITETDPTTRHQGWNPGNNVGWVQTAYREISNWNKDKTRQPIQALILYRWPNIPDQPEWAISTRPGIIEDFRAALRLTPATDYAVRLPDPNAEPVVLEPGNPLSESSRWIGRITATAGLNLRTGPSTQHHILHQLPHETLVTVLAEVDEWLYIEALSQRGYVAAAFVARYDIQGQLDREFLKDRADLTQAPLAPPTDQQIQIDGTNALWAERAIAAAWNQYGALLTTVSQLLGLDPAVGVAVFAIESGGTGFAADGRMLIRFENHVFFEEWGKLDPERFAAHLRFDSGVTWQGHQWRPDPGGEWRNFHGSQRNEWEVFEFVRANLDDRAAKRSISMGAPQIMGFNHLSVGYLNVEEMFAAFQATAHSHVLGFFDFVNADSGRLQALRSGDYLSFARSYNGAGQAAHYAALIQDGVNIFNRLRQRSQPADSRDSHGGHLPIPPTPVDGEGKPALDPEIYAAWRRHMIHGIEQNEVLFGQLLAAFMQPYRTTVWMYRSLFVVGIAAFVAALVMSWLTRSLEYAYAFGGLGALAFVSFFLSRPIRALEENLNFITWLGVIYNSYWTRLLYAVNLDTIQDDLEKITNDFVRQIQELLDKNKDHHDNRPGLR